MSTQVQWLSPSPLWSPLAGLTDKTAFRSPTLLRFSSDTFMPDLQSLLAQSPDGLAQYVAQPETWRSPVVGLSSTTKTVRQSNGDPAPTALKLFQPSHARFYLVSASLVCRLPALPDHTVKTSQGERTTFVLRRLQFQSSTTDPTAYPLDPQSYTELAWIPGTTPAGWVPAETNSVAPGEEKLPMFNFQFGSNGDRRRMFAGLIPVGRRQTYVGGTSLQKSGKQILPAVQDDPRKTDFQRQVLDPWADLVSWAAGTKDLPPGPPPLTADGTAAAQGSAFILIDFANFLNSNLPQVWAAVQNPSQAGVLTGDELSLYHALSATIGDALDSTRRTLAQAIALAKTFENAFNSEVLSTAQPLQSLPTGYPGPLLTDTSDAQLVALIGRASDQTPLPQRKIQTLVEAALDQAGPAPASQVPPPVNNPQNPQGNDWYIVRCVYDRPQCAVKGIPSPPTLSAPSRAFQMASYFDPDAPARRIQVALPVDTSAAALRKYDKGVAFMISDQLNQQMQRAVGLQDLMNGQVAPPGGFSLGMICSFSIPIITICAFIVLFIFVLLLNIVFFWMPFLKICFPLPTFNSKGN